MKKTINEAYQVAKSRYEKTKSTSDKKTLESIRSYAERWGGHVLISDQTKVRNYTARIVSARTGDSEKHCMAALNLMYKVLKNEETRKSRGE